ALAQTAEHHAATAGDGLDVLLEMHVHEIADLAQRAVAVDAQPDDGELVEVHLRDDGRIDVVGQAVGGGADGVLHILHRHVHVAAEAEVDGDDADSFEALRLDVVDPFDAGDRVLDDVGDVEVHRLGVGGLAVGGDVDNGEVDLRELTDP